MPRMRFALPAALFSSLSLFFSLFTWGEERIAGYSRFVFGFTPPAFSGDAFLFLADLFLALSPFAVLFFSLACLFEPRVKKALFLPALFPALYAVLRFFAFLFAGTLPETANRAPVWIFLLLLFLCSFFVPASPRPSFALLPLLFFLTETVLFFLSLIFEKNLSPHVLFQPVRLFGAYSLTRRLSLSALLYFSSLALSFFFLFLPEKKMTKQEEPPLS